MIWGRPTPDRPRGGLPSRFLTPSHYSSLPSSRTPAFESTHPHPPRPPHPPTVRAPQLEAEHRKAEAHASAATGGRTPRDLIEEEKRAAVVLREQLEQARA